MVQELQELGYTTHMVGKWHLGFCSEEYLPTNRGFDTFYGFYTGSEDYYLHSRVSSTPPIIQGYDLRDQEAVALQENGTYSAHIFSSQATSIIRQQAGSDQPMFLYLALQSVHSPLQVVCGHCSLYGHCSMNSVVCTDDLVQVRSL